MREHVAWLTRLSRYFHVPGPFTYSYGGVRDLAVAPSLKRFYLGRVWQEDDPETQRRKLTHEFVHLAGYPHSEAMRERGYFSKPERDTLTPQVHGDVKKGTPRFEPERFGLAMTKKKSTTSNPYGSRSRYQHEELESVPKGWRVRTVTKGGHQVRVAFPPGPRRKGTGKAISVLHPIRNPICATCPTHGVKIQLGQYATQARCPVGGEVLEVKGG